MLFLGLIFAFDDPSVSPAEANSHHHKTTITPSLESGLRLSDLLGNINCEEKKTLEWFSAPAGILNLETWQSDFLWALPCHIHRMIIFSTFCYSSREVSNIHPCLCFVRPRHATALGQWVTILKMRYNFHLCLWNFLWIKNCSWSALMSHIQLTWAVCICRLWLEHQPPERSNNDQDSLYLASLTLHLHPAPCSMCIVSAQLAAGAGVTSERDVWWNMVIIT